jgi:hypothetical protein
MSPVEIPRKYKLAEAHRGSLSGGHKAAEGSRKTGCAHPRSTTIADTRLTYRHRPDAGLDRPFRHMSMTHQTPAAIIRRQVGMSRKRFGDLRFNRLRQQGTRSVTENLGQRIGDLARLAQGDDFILFHGVSILVWICGWPIPPLITPPSFPAPSPTLPHSSRISVRCGAD